VSVGGSGGPSPLVYALDFPDAATAGAASLAVRESVGMLKVGLELFVAEGTKAIELGKDVGLPVFLDLKLHDIPETVERAVARVAMTGARYVTVHASGGPEMLARAVRRAKSDAPESSPLDIVAVTVLTSMDAEDLAHVGVDASVEEQAVRLARLAHEAGVRAFVCSPRELRALRRELGKEVTLVTPGIRASSRAVSEERDDQKRVATVTSAIQDGADWLVVGRPIRDAKDPLAAARALFDEARRARLA
jgi:orotidine-5'-phosphate decarboxylase